MLWQGPKFFTDACEKSYICNVYKKKNSSQIIFPWKVAKYFRSAILTLS